MTKIKIQIPKINAGEFKLKIDEKIVASGMPNSEIESEIGYGEHIVQLYSNIIAKTPKKKINIENDIKYKVTLNYKLWGIITVLHLIMVFGLIKFIGYAFFIIFPVVIIEFISIIIFGMFDLKEMK